MDEISKPEVGNLRSQGESDAATDRFFANTFSEIWFFIKT